MVEGGSQVTKQAGGRGAPVDKNAHVTLHGPPSGRSTSHI